MIIDKVKPIFVELTGKACLFELTMRLLVNRDGSKVKRKRCSKVNENSSLFGLCLEFVSNYGRIQELNDTLDKAINIVTRVVAESTGTEVHK